MNLLRYFVYKQESRDIWAKQVLDLYQRKISPKEIDNSVDGKAKDLNLLDRFKFFKYRYFLLSDLLFICHYGDKEKGASALDDIIGFYGERYRRKLSVIYDAFYSGNIETFSKDFKELIPIYEIIRRNKNFQQQSMTKVMITANMSAGKSTLLNALAGRKVNKTQNDSCTAKIHYLFNKAGEDGLIYEWDHDLELDATNEILMDDNENNETTEISVGARFRSVSEINKSICFIDTPGVNSSMDRIHRQISDDAIENMKCNLLIYLFNGENIGSEDDVKHIEFVKDHYKGKILFLVNRLDHFKKDADSIEETLSKVNADLKKIGFENPIVYPISAYAAYLAKMKMYGESLSEDEEDDLAFCERKLNREHFRYNEYYPSEINTEDGELQKLLLHSGILSLEHIIYDN